MFPILFRVGPFTLHTYGLMIAIGFLLALSFVRRSFDREGIPMYFVDRLAVSLMIGGIVGARLFYFGLNGFQELRGDFFALFRIWEGGLVYYGGFLAALIVLVIFSRVFEIDFVSLTDALSIPLFLGQALGRLGCFAAGCCYGKPTTLPWGVQFSHPESLAPSFVALHPTQLYAAIGNLLLFLIGWFWARKNPARGFLTAYYLLGYGFFRFFLEFLRGDDRGPLFNGLYPSQWVSLALVAGGIWLMVYVRQRKRF